MRPMNGRDITADKARELVRQSPQCNAYKLLRYVENRIHNCASGGIELAYIAYDQSMGMGEDDARSASAIVVEVLTERGFNVLLPSGGFRKIEEQPGVDNQEIMIVKWGSDDAG